MSCIIWSLHYFKVCFWNFSLRFSQCASDIELAFELSAELCYRWLTFILYQSLITALCNFVKRFVDAGRERKRVPLVLPRIHYLSIEQPHYEPHRKSMLTNVVRRDRPSSIEAGQLLCKCKMTALDGPGGVSAVNDAGCAIYETAEHQNWETLKLERRTTGSPAVEATITYNQSIFISVTTRKQNLCNKLGSGLAGFCIWYMVFCCCCFFSTGSSGLYGQLEIFQSHRVRGPSGGRAGFRRAGAIPIQRQFSLSFAQKAEPGR